VEIHGHVAPGFDAVSAAFARNFAVLGELGAAFAAEVDGVPVVDVWAGFADAEAERRWERDTVATIFSGSKGLVAVCALILVDRGLLELDAPVARYWPEFAAAGKSEVLVRHVLSHTAGLPGVRRRLTLEDVLDATRMAALLADEPLYAPPGSVLQYHRLSYGWICGELVRRLTGRTIGAFFADEVAGPLGLDAWIGLPEAVEDRVAVAQLADTWGQRVQVFDPSVTAADPLMGTVWTNPTMYAPGHFHFNEPRVRAAEIPAAGGIALARSLARLYACLANGGQRGGVSILSPEAVAVGRHELSRGPEHWLRRDMAYGAGFALQTDRLPLGPPADAFGHTGAGGSVHGAWPSLGVGFSYVMTLMRDGEDRDGGRGAALLEALHQALADRSVQA
jgi:CubicO group peptidase (beta-lactamase class C family)